METKDILKFNKEISVLRAEIGALYAELDRQFGLHGAEVDISFGYDEEALGSYTQENADGPEHFHFSLPFIAYSSAAQLSKSDREDLYRHEYAHYMSHVIDIPEEYKWQSGTHGSAWKYCCSLVGAVPSPYYKAGESLKKQNYDSVLKKKNIADPRYPLLDNYRREKEAQRSSGEVPRYKEGDRVEHPKYGTGVIMEIRQSTGAVQLVIDFGAAGVRTIDQKWLMRSQYTKK